MINFQLAGSQGGASNVDPAEHTTTISFSLCGTSQSITPRSDRSLNTDSFWFTICGGKLGFTDLADVNANVGSLLDKLSVSRFPSRRLGL